MSLQAAPVKSTLDFNNIPVKNFRAENKTSAPSSPMEGREYYNEVSHEKQYWDGSKWVKQVAMATDEQAATGALENVTTNPKQLKAVKDACEPLLGYTPENIANKVTSIDGTSTDTQYPTAKLLYDLLLLKAALASPAFTGIPTAPTAAAGTSTTQIATTAFVATAITAALTGALLYRGPWDTSSATDFSALHSYRPLRQGNLFKCIGTGCVINGTDYKAGDLIILNQDVGETTAVTSAMIDKYDHTQSEDTVLLDAIQTLTNKSINASNNTITNLTLAMFAAGVVATTLGSTPSDAVILTEKAIANLLALKAPLASPTFTGTPTAPTPTTGTDTTQIATTAFVNATVAANVSGLARGKAYTQSAILTTSNNICRWEINHDLNTTNVFARVLEVSTGQEIAIVNKAAVSSSVYAIEFTSDTNIAANTYKAILIGVD